MKNRKVPALLLALTMVLALAACGSPAPATTTAPPATTAPATTAPATPEPTPEPVELVVFAAASLKESLSEIIELYKAEAPNVTISVTFDSSGTLKTQIQEGADCDLFISAAMKQMNQLDIGAKPEVNTEGLDFVLTETRVKLLENKVVLAVPEGNPAGIAGFEDLAKAELIALGNSDVPVGSYSLEILKYLNLDVAALETAGKITYGSNVKEVTTQVSEGTVDCGIVYATDAFSAKLEVAAQATPEMCSQVIYPAAVMKSSKNVEAAQAFLDFLSSPTAVAAFETVGFAMAK